VSDLNLQIGRRVRTRRRLMNMTQQQLGEAMGVRFQQIQKYETGANRLTADKLPKLAEILEVPVEYFFQCA
jgi:transcriptional regulator with XRE-family HTH domain